MVKGIIVFYLLLVSLGACSNENDLKLEAAFHFPVSINAGKDAVWPFLFQVDKWKYSVSRLRSKHLTADQEGGVVEVFQGGASDKPSLLIKTLKIVPNEHYSFSIYANTGQFVGFAAYNLKEEKGKTSVTYDVYIQTAMPGASSHQVEERKKLMVDEMENRQPKELATLKALVEQGA